MPRSPRSLAYHIIAGESASRLHRSDWIFPQASHNTQTPLWHNPPSSIAAEPLIPERWRPTTDAQATAGRFLLHNGLTLVTVLTLAFQEIDRVRAEHPRHEAFQALANLDEQAIMGLWDGFVRRLGYRTPDGTYNAQEVWKWLLQENDLGIYPAP